MKLNEIFIIICVIFFGTILLFVFISKIIRFINNILDNKLKFQIEIRVIKNENKSS